ncbi:hypothetical protein BU15DRAFT_82546 [Melanogaster broomeanus]|nr:hypothetical protein BU15DRAFT_82546 [Melanogaster broomeanus]
MPIPNPAKMSLLHPHAFAPGRLADSDGLSDAFATLESCLEGSDARLNSTVQDLCSVPHLFEFIISVWPSAGALVARILHAYPSDPALIYNSSASALLVHLSSVLFALPPHLFSSDVLRDIGRYRVYIENAMPVLSLLSSEEQVSMCFVSGNKQRRHHCRNKNERGPAIDVAPFHKLQEQVPSSAEAAAQMASRIGDNLKVILQYYLDLLLDPLLAQPFSDAYLPAVDDWTTTLCFDNADGFGDWRILIGTGATKKLQELTKRDRKQGSTIVRKIKQLSKGHFSEDNQKRLNDSAGVPVYEAKIQNDLRLVIDLAPDRDTGGERQAIRIYGIFTHKQVNRIWDAIGRHLAGKGEEYRRRNRPTCPGGDVYMPACFPPETTQSDVKTTPLVLSGKDMDELHSLLVLDKYVTFSQGFLNGLIANQDVEHVFELTPQERVIVDCKASCYVLGRSGTGKTTTMLFKMLGIQRAWEMQMSGTTMPKPRQIFVTKSRVLASKVEEYFTKLLESLALAGYSLEQLKQMKDRTTTQAEGLVDPDDIPEDKSGIPMRYSALEASHFPLFVTFDKLVRMIAADVLSVNDRAANPFIETDEVEGQQSLVTYDTFSRMYWPHFSQPLTKGLESWLVYSEFMGIIKGSERSLSCSGGFLDKETYCTLSARSNPTFATQRETVYALFEAYCKLKTQRRQHDVADRTYAILKKMVLRRAPLGGQQTGPQGAAFRVIRCLIAEFLSFWRYVDEAQDNLLIDALLLRLICRNPEGLFWAGDTAQTISAGSSFRFNDLKAFLYRIEEDQSTTIIQDRSVTQPTSFQLTINHRSHGGIVNCAHAVIELITLFWPNSIDGLQPEHGILDGLKPVFFHGWDEDTVRYEQFLCGASGGHIEFGAQQCILVRNQAAREKLRQQVGNVGLIMTLYESKGLEFNDVLLYNFFEDSPVDLSRWCVVLGATAKDHELSNIHAPAFERDEGRYAGVCSELKQLYVGITRARENLWIVDKSEKCEPMRMFWTSRGQVQNCTPGTDVPHLAMSSTKEEWEESGRSLFQHKRYAQAMHCFERACLRHEVKVSEAYHLRELARASVGVATPVKQQDAFRIAAKAFVDCGANRYHQTRERLQYYRNAADCYVRAGDDSLAANAYVHAEEYELAAKRYRKVGRFRKTLQLVNTHSEKMTQESADELLMNTARPPEPLFETFEEEFDFLETYDLDVALVELLELHGKFVEAAELHLSEGRPLDAIKSFLKDKGNDAAVSRAGDTLLENLWRRCSFGVSVKDALQDDTTSQCFALIKEIPLEKLVPQNHDQILMFQAVAEHDRDALENLATSFLEKGDDNTATLWTLDHCFSQLPRLVDVTLQELTVFLRRYYAYARLLFLVASHNDPIGNNNIRKLVGITKVSHDKFNIYPGAFLSDQPTSTVDNAHQTPPSFSKIALTRLLRKRMRKHLHVNVSAENKYCYKAKVFSQCLSFFMKNDACKYDRCHQEHVPMKLLNQTQYNDRVGVHLQQMRILQLVYSAQPHLRRYHNVKSNIAGWLNHLYEAVFPPVCYQGSVADIDWSTIQDASDGICVVREWIRDAIYSLDPISDSESFLTSILRLTKLSFAFDELDTIQHITQARSVRCFRAPQLLRGPEGAYIVEDRDMLTSVEGLTPTSISSGVLYLYHIVEKKLPVNLSVLCDYAEDVCSSIVLSLHLNRRDIPPLHGLVLPRGWLMRRNKFKKGKDLRMIHLFLDVMQDLLNGLRQETPQEVYWLEHTKITVTHRNIFIQRICRMLCLLAYNAYTRDIRSRIIEIMSRLRSIGPERATPFVYRRFTDVLKDGFLQPLQFYDNQSVIECFVQLVHKSQMSYTRSISPRIKQIVYDRVDEIPTVIAPYLVSGGSILPADAPIPVLPAPHTVHLEPQAVAQNDESVQGGGPEAQGELLDTLPEQQQEAVDVALSPAVDKLIRPAEPSDAQVAAARVIQGAYREYSKRLRWPVRTGTTAERHAIFEACLKHVESWGWERSSYRLLYLGPFPHLFLALERGMTTAHALKAKTKAHLKVGGHEGLEELGRQLSEIASLLKKGASLRKKLYPGAPFHEERDTEALQRAVSEVREFVQALRGGSLEALQEVGIAHKGIVAEKSPPRNPPPRKAAKPSLNVEDLDPYF